MRISSGVSHISNVYIYNNYPSEPVKPVSRVSTSSQYMGSINSMKIIAGNYSPGPVSFSVPGGIIVGYYIDLYA
ncbi:MAG TPA: hypothetical protein PKW55_01860 [Spirochaetota bacterium]|nr:hypothetical protein [Spirochaetota bacterium]HOM38401.1 hypothetical protein [Spirochaetota bacterium]HPQ48381.1 hypothetical protein [Spirochaetota bacterium]